MRPTRRVERDSSGTWTVVPVPQSQTEATAGNQVAANRSDIEEQKQTQSQTFTLKSWKIDPNINRTQICLWILTFITKLLCILIMIAFWMSFIMFFKTLVFWRGPQRILRAFMDRREKRLRNIPIHPEMNLWNDIFVLIEEDTTSYTLRLRLSAWVLDVAADEHTWDCPLLVHNPVMWSIILFILVICYYLSTFVHCSLQKASHVMRTREKKSPQLSH
jgi:hypothetical protein